MGTKIDSYAFGHVVVDGRSYTSDVIVFPDGAVEGWSRVEAADFYEVVRGKPEVLVVGCGCYNAMEVPATTADYVWARGIDLVQLDIAAAVELFNRLSGKKKVAAALHLTC